MPTRALAIPQDNAISNLVQAGPVSAESLAWVESALPCIMRRLMDSENLDMPLLQLPLAQMRLAQSLFGEGSAESQAAGETMGRLSEKLGVRQNALTQAADRLVNHGLAERLSDAHDRRIVRLRLTAKGSEWVEARRLRRHARFERLWSLLNETERAEVLQAVQILEAAGNRLETFHQGEKTNGIAETGAEPSLTIEETLSRFTAGAANGAPARIREQE